MLRSKSANKSTLMDKHWFRYPQMGMQIRFIHQKVLIFTQTKMLKMFNPSTYGVGEPCRPLHVLVYCPLLKISLVNLIIPDLAKLFVADAPIKKNTKKIVLPPSQITLKFGIKNRPLFEGCNKHHKLCKFKADHQT